MRHAFAPATKLGLILAMGFLVQFALFEAPAGRSSVGTLKPGLLPGDSAYVDPTSFLEHAGYRANYALGYEGEAVANT